MKKSINNLVLLILAALTSYSCQSKEHPKPDVTPKKIVENKKMATSKFSGKFLGVMNGSEIIINLISQNNSAQISGEMLTNNERAVINASERDGICKGSIVEDISNKTYDISMEFVSDKLLFSITFPEYNNQTVTIELGKIDAKKSITQSNSNKIRNANLVGTWRYTEVLSSGSGAFYTSLSTDYFAEFKADGHCVTWTGKSAGGSNDVSLQNASNGTVENAQWYTEGNMVVFVNPATKKEVRIPYYAESNRMILKGSVNRVYQRVN